MAPHSNTLAWKSPWMEEPGRLQSMGSLRVGHDWATSLSLSTFHFHALEKEMATHSSVLAWKIPWTLEPEGLPSMGSHRVGHDWSDTAAAAVYIMGNARLEESQAGIKIAGRNINNLRYADDTIFIAESEEEVKSLFESERVEWKCWLKAQHSENEDHGIWSHHFMGNRSGNSRNSVRLYLWGLQNHCRW